MNEIFIILKDNYDFVFLIFDNYKNECIFQKKKYNFTFITTYKLRIFNHEHDVILTTIDSFIYSDDESQLNYFKLIELIHNEWFDQCLLNYKNKEIIRIKHRDQSGIFEINKNYLKVTWNNWGDELFIQKEKNIYLQENYFYKNKSLYDINYKKQNKIIIFIHCCAFENGLNILFEQLDKIIKSNLYNECEKIIVHILGYNYNDLINEYQDKYKIEFIYSKFDINYYELITINMIYDYFKNKDENYNVLYIHSKGVRKAGNEEVIYSWRDMMEYYLIEKYEYCNYLLNENIANTLGNNIINSFDIETDKFVLLNKDHCYHYSGNFWWTQSNYIKKLEPLKIEENKEKRFIQRYQAENWILSKKEKGKSGILYQNNTNLHPYHRIIFKNYLNKNILIKLI
jgi:hypothetical protein